MNYEVSRRLANLGKKIPRELLKKGVKEVDYGSEQKEKIEKILRNGYVERASQNMKSIGGRERVKVSEKTRMMLSKQIEMGRFENKKREIDKNVEKEISKAWDQIIKSERQAGRLPSREEARVDYNKFMASRRR